MTLRPKYGRQHQSNLTYSNQSSPFTNISNDMEPTQVPSESQIPLRHSSHLTKVSSHLQDYQVNHALLLAPGTIPSSTSGTRYPLNRYISYSNFSHAHRKFVHNISHLVKPVSYEQASQDPKWVDAMQTEL